MTQTIGEFLANLRKSKGLTQEDVAKQLHISNKTLSSWEKGRTTPDICALPALAEIYGVTIDEIVRGQVREDQPAVKPVISEESRMALTKGLLTKLKLRERMLSFFFVLSVLIALLGLVILILAVESPIVGAFFAIVGLCAMISFTIAIIGSAQFFLLNIGDSEKARATASRVQKKTALFFLLPTVVFLGVFITMLTLADNHYFAYNVQAYLSGETVLVDRKAFFYSLIASTGAVGFAYLILTVIHYVGAVKKYDCCGVKKARAIKISAAILILLAFVGSYLCFFYNSQYTNRGPSSPVLSTAKDASFDNYEDFSRWAQTIVISEYTVDWESQLYSSKRKDLYIPYDCELAEYYAEGTNKSDVLVSFIDLGNDLYALLLVPSSEYEPRLYRSGDPMPIGHYAYETVYGTYAVCHLITDDMYECAPEDFASYTRAIARTASYSAPTDVYYFYPICKNASVYCDPENCKKFLFCRAPQYPDASVVKTSGLLIETETIIYPGYNNTEDTYGMILWKKTYYGPLIILLFSVFYAAAVFACVFIYRKVLLRRKNRPAPTAPEEKKE